MDNIVKEVSNKVCLLFQVEEKLIYSGNKSAQVTLARGYIVYILHKKYGISASKIAKIFNFTPRSVFWHVSKIDNYIKTYNDYKEKYRNLCEIIN